MNTPVALFIFNRPHTTSQVFQQIRRARPSRLFVIADGPRIDRPDDRQRCDAAREATGDVDWPCDVQREYAEANLGQRKRIETGLTWVFDHVDETVVLEDDCLPHATFFGFCGQLLDRYRDEARVMTVSGNRLMPTRGSTERSYHFSRYPLIWGWATWRRAWQHYDGDMRAWPELRDAGWLNRQLDSQLARDYWTYILEKAWASPQTRSWDYAWALSSWRRQGFSIIPSVNLVSNIGFGADATHNTNSLSRYAATPTEAMPFPLGHSDAIVRDEDEDRRLEAHLFSGTLARVLARAKEGVRHAR